MITTGLGGAIKFIPWHGTERGTPIVFSFVGLVHTLKMWQCRQFQYNQLGELQLQHTGQVESTFSTKIHHPGNIPKRYQLHRPW
jgi:hypothetical protein